MESIGKELKRAREEKGLSYEEIFAQTKVHHSVIKMIEEDRIGELATVYARGFLRIYTQLLGLNTEEFIQAYEKERGIPPKKQPKPGVKKREFKKISLPPATLRRIAKITIIVIGMVIAALSAEGETVITDVRYIERGYDNLEGKLTALGANITREEG